MALPGKKSPARCRAGAMKNFETRIKRVAPGGGATRRKPLHSGRSPGRPKCRARGWALRFVIRGGPGTPVDEHREILVAPYVMRPPCLFRPDDGRSATRRAIGASSPSSPFVAADYVRRNNASWGTGGHSPPLQICRAQPWSPVRGMNTPDKKTPARFRAGVVKRLA